MGLLAKQIDLDKMSVDEISEVMTKLVPGGREAAGLRLAAAHPGGRLAAAARRGARGHRRTTSLPRSRTAPRWSASGFADIVNYTRQSRSLSRSELTELVDGFEARALEIITAHDGRIVKTIGDEVLFVADKPDQIAYIGLELVEERLHDEDFPELRVGLAWGPAVARLGDVLGPVVNVASRLTSTSRPGRVLTDRMLADELEGNEHFRLRRLRRTSVRGYRRLEPWSLRRPADEDPEITEDGALPGPVSTLLAQRRQGIRRLIDKGDPAPRGVGRRRGR